MLNRFIASETPEVDNGFHCVCRLGHRHLEQLFLLRTRTPEHVISAGRADPAAFRSRSSPCV